MGDYFNSQLWCPGEEQREPPDRQLRFRLIEPYRQRRRPEAAIAGDLCGAACYSNADADGNAYSHTHGNLDADPHGYPYSDADGHSN